MQYEPDLIHAIDGLGTGLVIVPVLGNFMIKIYRTIDKGLTYGNIVKAMLEIVTYMVNLQKNTIVKVSIHYSYMYVGGSCIEVKVINFKESTYDSF